MADSKKTNHTKELGNYAPKVGKAAVGFFAASTLTKKVPESMKKYAPVGLIALSAAGMASGNEHVQDICIGSGIAGISATISQVTAPKPDDSATVSGLKGVLRDVTPSFDSVLPTADITQALRPRVAMPSFETVSPIQLSNAPSLNFK